MKRRIQRLHRQHFAHHRDRFVEPPEATGDIRQLIQGFGIRWIERDGFLQRRFGCCHVEIGPGLIDAEGSQRHCRTRIQRNSLIRIGACYRPVRLALHVICRPVDEPLLGDREPRIGHRVVGIEPDRQLVIVHGLQIVRAIAALGIFTALQQRVVGIEVAARRLVDGLDDLAEQGRLQRASDRCRDLALHREHILQLAIVGLRPQLAAVGCLDQRRDDAHLIALLAYCSFEQRRHAELRPDGGSIVLLFAAELERRIAPDHLDVVHLRDRRDQFFRQTVGKIILLRIAAFVDQRQHRDGFVECDAGT